MGPKALPLFIFAASVALCECYALRSAAKGLQGASQAEVPSISQQLDANNDETSGDILDTNNNNNNNQDQDNYFDGSAAPFPSSTSQHNRWLEPAVPSSGASKARAVGGRARLGRLRAVLRRYFPQVSSAADSPDDELIGGSDAAALKPLHVQIRSTAPISSAQLVELLEQVAQNKQQRQIQQQQQQQQQTTSGHKAIRNVQPVVMRLPPRFGRASISTSTSAPLRTTCAAD